MINELEKKRFRLFKEIREISKDIEYLKIWVETDSVHINKKQFEYHFENELHRLNKWKEKTERYMSDMESNYLNNLKSIEDHGAEVIDGKVKMFQEKFKNSSNSKEVLNKAIDLSKEINRTVWFVSLAGEEMNVESHYSYFSTGDGK